ncbi:ATP-binding protein [Achromobacter mucicolens]|uniref:sensor histidine kinase n=1 Tax=Achromobacter mucicolens TaxID=1389922 RepID=UPI0014697E46|nr:ATP-binding protein [Achromobacter mucicolens]MDG9971049.1 ATP-binding protein [Achromobacter mucicolens]CAB3905610.1 Adaptive-response sensory-kinase SasA [Achromobacter mucicolens]
MDYLRRIVTSDWRDYRSGALLALAMWISFAAWISWDRTEELRSAETASSTLAETLAANTRQVLGEAEQVAAVVAREVQTYGVDLDLKQLKDLGLLHSDVFLQVAVSDRNGILRASSLPTTGALDLSDRDHIRVHLEGRWPRNSLYISKPLVGRLSGRTSIQLTRAIIDKAGDLVGIVTISVAPSYFTDLYKLLDIGQQGMVTVIGSEDYVVRARRTSAGEAVGDELGASNRLREMNQRQDVGSFRGKSPIDGIDRISSYQLLSPYPLIVVVGYATEEYLAAYRNRRDLLLLTGAIITLLMAFAEWRKVRLVRKTTDLALRERAATERQAEKAAYLQAWFRAIPDAAAALTNGKVLNVNPKLLNLVDLKSDEVSGSSVERLAELLLARDVSGDRGEKIRALVDALKRIDPGAGRKMVIQIQDARLHVFEFRVEALEAPHSGAVLLIRDISAESQVDRMKSEFISTAAHELRTPTAGILGLAELLTLERVPEPRKQAIYRMICSQAANLSRLVADLLDLARIEARANKEIRHEEIDLVEAVCGVVGRLPESPSRVRMQLPPLPVRIRGELPLIESVIRNVLENAIKYSDANSPIDVCLVEDEGSALLTIRDRGIGISSDDLERIFEKFYRVNRNGPIPGTGLGLALVSEIVHLHGGKVWVDSELGSGTSVHISLAVAQRSIAAPS